MSHRATALFARLLRGFGLVLLRSGDLIRCDTPFVKNSAA